MGTNKVKSKKDQLPPIDDGITPTVEPADVAKNQEDESFIWFIWVKDMWTRLADVKVDLSSAIPTATTFLVLLGAFNIYHYYSLFGINVIPFLEPIELIFSFANLLPMVFFTFVSSVTLVLCMQSFRKSKYVFIKMLIFLLFTPFFSMLLALIFNVDAVEDYWGGLLQLALMLPIFVIYGPGWGLKPILKASLVFIVISTYLAGVNAWKGRQILVDRVHRYDVEVIFENRTVNTNDQFFYIGTTKGYMFFWNSALGRSVMYPISDAQSIQIRDRVKVKDLNDYKNWVKNFPSSLFINKFFTD